MYFLKIKRYACVNFGISSVATSSTEMIRSVCIPKNDPHLGPRKILPNEILLFYAFPNDNKAGAACLGHPIRISLENFI